MAGLIAVPVNAKLHPKELAFILDDSGARWVISDAAWCSALATANLERRIEFGGPEYSALPSADFGEPAVPDAAAWLFYTSGRPAGRA